LNFDKHVSASEGVRSQTPTESSSRNFHKPDGILKQWYETSFACVVHVKFLGLKFIQRRLC